MYFGNEALISEEITVHPLLTIDVVTFLDRLHNHFDHKRRELLQLRGSVIKQEQPEYSPFQPAIPYTRLNDEENILAPADKQTMFHALQKGANQYIADFEHEKSSTWEMLMYWQQNMYDAIRLENGFYLIKNMQTEIALKPRALHVEERNLTKEMMPMSASLVDFGIYMYHNALQLLKQNRRPHVYLSGIHNHLEARLWNDLLIYAQNDLQIPQGSIQVTLIHEDVIETSQLCHILYELADHCVDMYDNSAR